MAPVGSTQRRGAFGLNLLHKALLRAARRNTKRITILPCECGRQPEILRTGDNRQYFSSACPHCGIRAAHLGNAGLTPYDAVRKWNKVREKEMRTAADPSEYGICRICGYGRCKQSPKNESQHLCPEYLFDEYGEIGSVEKQCEYFMEEPKDAK